MKKWKDLQELVEMYKKSNSDYEKELLYEFILEIYEIKFIEISSFYVSREDSELIQGLRILLHNNLKSYNLDAGAKFATYFYKSTTNYCNKFLSEKEYHGNSLSEHQSRKLNNLRKKYEKEEDDMTEKEKLEYASLSSLTKFNEIKDDEIKNDKNSEMLSGDGCKFIISLLDDYEFRIVKMLYVGYTHNDIAKILKESQQFISYRIKKIRQKLRNNGIDY